MQRCANFHNGVKSRDYFLLKTWRSCRSCFPWFQIWLMFDRLRFHNFCLLGSPFSPDPVIYPTRVFWSLTYLVSFSCAWLFSYSGLRFSFHVPGPVWMDLGRILLFCGMDNFSMQPHEQRSERVDNPRYSSRCEQQVKDSAFLSMSTSMSPYRSCWKTLTRPWSKGCYCTISRILMTRWTWGKRSSRISTFWSRSLFPIADEIAFQKFWETGQRKHWGTKWLCEVGGEAAVRNPRLIWNRRLRFFLGP